MLSRERPASIDDKVYFFCQPGCHLRVYTCLTVLLVFRYTTNKLVLLRTVSTLFNWKLKCKLVRSYFLRLMLGLTLSFMMHNNNMVNKDLHNKQLHMNTVERVVCVRLRTTTRGSWCEESRGCGCWDGGVHCNSSSLTTVVLLHSSTPTKITADFIHSVSRPLPCVVKTSSS